MKKKIDVIKTMNIDIQGITLLSKEEYEAHKDIIPLIKSCWWLRSPGSRIDYATYVDSDGCIDDKGYHVCYVNSFGYRPALLCDIKSTNLEAGDKVEIAGYSWTVLNDNMMLCDESIACNTFRLDWKAEDANVYEASDVKRWLENWYKQNIYLQDTDDYLSFSTDKEAIEYAEENLGKKEYQYVKVNGKITLLTATSYPLEEKFAEPLYDVVNNVVSNLLHEAGVDADNLIDDITVDVQSEVRDALIKSAEKFTDIQILSAYLSY